MRAPGACQGWKRTDGAAFDIFGYAAALSRDGSTALVGAPGKAVGANLQQGAAYVYARSGSTWSQQTTLTCTVGAAGDGFGVAAALSADGSTALVGASNKTVGTNADQDAAYVLVHGGSTWPQLARLTANDGARGDLFGRAVALSADGYTVLAGAYGTTVGGNVQLGAAYIMPTASATINLSLSSGRYTDPVTVTGSGFGNGETVNVYLDAPTSPPLTSTTSTAVGGLSAAFTAPQAISGTHGIIAVGQSSHGVALATLALNPALRVKPTSAAPGAVVTVSGTGYGAHETVTLKYNCGAAGCTSTTVLATPSTDGNGFFSVPMTLPAHTSAGVHAIGGRGFTSGVFAATTITIT